MLILLHMLLGAVLPLSKWLMVCCSPLLLVGLRMVCAAVPLIIYGLIKSGRSVWSLYAIARPLVPAVVTGIYIKDVGKYWALSQLSVSNVSLLLQLSPLVSALFSYTCSGYSMSRFEWLGIAIASTAIVPLAQAGQIDTLFLWNASWLPGVVLLGALVSHAYSMVLLKRLIESHAECPFVSNGIRMLLGGVTIIVTAYCIGGIKPIANPIQFFGWLLILSLLSNGVGHTVYYFWAVKNYSPVFLALTDFLSPLFSMIYALIFLDERLTLGHFIATVILIVGVSMFYFDQKNSWHNAHSIGNK